MRKRHSNKINSYKGVLGLLQDNKEITGKLPALSKAIKEFEKLVDEMIESGVKVNKGSKPAIQQREKERKELALETLAMAGLLGAFAYDTGDIKLEKESDLSFTKIYYGRYQETGLKAIKIEKLLRKHSEALKPYLTTDKGIEAFSKRLKQYKDTETMSIASKAEVIATRSGIDRLIREIDNLLSRKIDHLVLALKSNHPSFYDQYINTRQIIDL